MAYMSIFGGFSHGCHRLHNHLAVRLFSFILRHSSFRRRGQVPLRYGRTFSYRGRTYKILLHTRGYYYTLTRPVEVLVKEGRIRGKVKEPIERYMRVPGEKYDPDDPDDPVNSLLALLCAKASKGLDVKVLVDDVTTKDYPWTIAYLKSCGVKVKVWKSRANLHAKVVIVDEEHLLLGSHNWTESALRYNVEVSVYTRSPGAVREALNLFNKLWALASSA